MNEIFWIRVSRKKSIRFANSPNPLYIEKNTFFDEIFFPLYFCFIDTSYGTTIPDFKSKALLDYVVYFFIKSLLKIKKKSRIKGARSRISRDWHFNQNRKATTRWRSTGANHQSAFLRQGSTFSFFYKKYRTNSK